MTTLKGLILKERDSGEASKSICVLTAERGIIYIYIRGGRKSSKSSSSTQMFGYSSLCFEEKRNAKGITSYYLNSSEPIKLFYNIRLEPARMALAAYFSQLLIYTGTQETDCTRIMRLALNTMYFLNQGKTDMELLRSVFELRLICEIGLCPKLLGCRSCFRHEAERMYYCFESSELVCGDCFDSEDQREYFELDKTLLYIIRYIALSEMDKLFSFRISQRYQQRLTVFCEKLIKYDLKRDLDTLEFYKMMR